MIAISIGLLYYSRIRLFPWLRDSFMASTITKTVQYPVKKGDKLIKICKAHGLEDWKAVWEHKDNNDLRKQRKKPEDLQPGDVVVLNPQGPDPKEVKETLKQIDGIIAGARNKISRLQETRKSQESLKKQILADLAGSYRQAKNTGDTVDAVATVTMLLIDLGKLARQAHKTISLTGEALEKANKELLKDVAKTKAQQAADMGALLVSQTEPKDSAAKMALKAAAEAWSSISTPSFWAYAYVKGLEEWKKSGSIPRAWSKGVTADPKSDYEAAVKSVEAGFARSTKTLDEAIAFNESRLAQAVKDRGAYAKDPAASK
jgi:hypothetical protein